MHSDSIFIQGSSHKVCQDYVIHGNVLSTHYVILSDGCSSSPDTDIGARLLALEALKKVNQYGSRMIEFSPLENIIMNASEVAKGYGLPEQCLDATLIILLANPHDGFFSILGMGDGGFVYKVEEASTMRVVEFADNYPVYPSYLLHGEVAVPKTNDKITTTTKLNNLNYYINSEQWNMKPSINFGGPIGDIEFVGIFSDGVSSFVGKEDPSNIIPEMNIVKGLIDFKQTKGEFVKRKVGSYLKKLSKEGISHYDDLSFGGIYLKD